LEDIFNLERESPQLQQSTNGFAPNGSATEELNLVDARWGRPCSGAGLLEALNASARWLAQHVEAINALNVFPVPDGDTGTNMNLTMEAAVKEVETKSHTGDTAEHIGKLLSFGALMGARGNSGVILSQIIRGLADGFSGKQHVDGHDFAHALVKAKEMAYRAVIKPVEGTMLTVVREASEAAVSAAGRHNNLYYVLLKTVDAASEAVKKTPTLLPVLREAGVVDAGGHGCYVLLEGILKHMRGEELVKTELSEVEQAKPKFDSSVTDNLDELDAFGYCTNFMLLTAAPVDFDKVRDELVGMGQSAVIVGDQSMVKVHIHTENPGKVISYATSLGALTQIKLDNMQIQHEEAFGNSSNKSETKNAKTGSVLADEDQDVPDAEPDSISIVAVAPGRGLFDVFKGFGVSYAVTGGQTMNPSTEDLLKAVERVPGNRVIILPNNKNIIMVAQQIATLTKKEVAVVPTKTIPQGITALTRFNSDASLDENREMMTAALGDVKTGEVTRAVRTASINGISVTDGQWIGLIDDELRLATDSKENAVWELLDRMSATNAELLTFYYGQDVSEPEAETMRSQVEARFPDAAVEMLMGGQPHYHYIISVE
jgi:uncharacterized protein